MVQSSILSRKNITGPSSRMQSVSVTFNCLFLEFDIAHRKHRSPVNSLCQNCRIHKREEALLRRPSQNSPHDSNNLNQRLTSLRLLNSYSNWYQILILSMQDSKNNTFDCWPHWWEWWDILGKGTGGPRQWRGTLRSTGLYTTTNWKVFLFLWYWESNNNFL